MDYSPVILKNKGVPCKFIKLVENGETWERVVDEDGEPKTETQFVKFTNNSISDIELHYGGLDAWQEQLEKFPVTAVRQTLSFVLQQEPVRVGEAMLDGEIVMYSNVIGTAWSIANGVDPTVASQVLQQSTRLAEEQKRLLNDQMSKAVKVTPSPGTSGTDSGPKRASRSKNSGN